MPPAGGAEIFGSRIPIVTVPATFRGAEVDAGAGPAVAAMIVLVIVIVVILAVVSNI